MDTSQANQASVEPSQPPSLLWHGLAFNVIWFVVVIAQWGMVASLLTILWFVCSAPRTATLKLIVGLTSLGIIADFAFVNMGFLIFDDNTINPLWLGILWAAFARFAFIFLQHWPLPYWQLAVISAIAGPFSYYIGHLNQAVNMKWQTFPQNLLFVLFWSAVLPLALFCWRKFK